MTKTIYQECIEIVKDLVGNEYLYFDSAIEVKVSPHSFPFAAWAVSVSPKNGLFIMDNNEQWHQVELIDDHASLVIGSLYQRLRLIRIQYAKAS
jgi:hypothetical protein